MFDRAGFKILRIDQFDSGNFAKIRTELKYDQLSAAQLLEIATKLMSLEKNENLEIQIVNIDMIHKTMRVEHPDQGRRRYDLSVQVNPTPATSAPRFFYRNLLQDGLNFNQVAFLQGLFNENQKFLPGIHRSAAVRRFFLQSARRPEKPLFF